MRKSNVGRPTPSTRRWLISTRIVDLVQPLEQAPIVEGAEVVVRPRRPQQDHKTPPLQPPLIFPARHDQKPRVLRRRPSTISAVSSKTSHKVEISNSFAQTHRVAPDSAPETQSFARNAAASGRRRMKA